MQDKLDHATIKKRSNSFTSTEVFYNYLLLYEEKKQID